MNITLIIIFLGCLYFLAHVFASLFNRTKIPDVLWLMIIGLCLGPVFHLLDPSTFGNLGQVFVAVTLVVLLFQSGLGISVQAFLGAWARGLALAMVNFLATTVVVGIVTYFLLGLTPFNAILIGATVGGTSSAIVVPILQQLELRPESKAVLIFESALTDVLCIVIVLALLDVQTGGAKNPGILVGSIIASFLVAIVLGIVGAILWSLFLASIRTIQNSIFATPAFVFILFGIAELLGFSGYIAALAFGITMGNAEGFKKYFRKLKFGNGTVHPSTLNDTEKSFFSEMVFLLKTFFFVYIGVSIRLNDMVSIYIGLALTLICFVLRVPVVNLSVSRHTSKRDASLMAVIVPKGLAAAALASLPLQRGIAGGETIQNVVFAVVLLSITLTSILVWFVHKTPLGRFYQRLFPRFTEMAAGKAAVKEAA